MISFVSTPAFIAQFREITVGKWLAEHPMGTGKPERVFWEMGGFSRSLGTFRKRLCAITRHIGTASVTDSPIIIERQHTDILTYPLAEWLRSERSHWKAEADVVFDASVLKKGQLPAFVEEFTVGQMVAHYRSGSTGWIRSAENGVYGTADKIQTGYITPELRAVDSSGKEPS